MLNQPSSLLFTAVRKHFLMPLRSLYLCIRLLLLAIYIMLEVPWRPCVLAELNSVSWNGEKIVGCISTWSLQSNNIYLGSSVLQAERTQKKGGMVMCANVLVILIFIMIVLLILKEIIFWHTYLSHSTGNAAVRLNSAIRFADLKMVLLPIFIMAGPATVFRVGHNFFASLQM